MKLFFIFFLIGQASVMADRQKYLGDEMYLVMQISQNMLYQPKQNMLDQSNQNMLNQSNTDLSDEDEDEGNLDD